MKYLHLTLPLLVLLLWSCNAEVNVHKGDRYFALGEYFDASVEYKKAYSRTAPKEKQKRGERALKMADCYRRINYTAKAVGAYQNAVRYKVKDSTAIYYLAEMQRKMGDYRAAEKNYRAYLDLTPGDSMCLRGITSCQVAPEWKKNLTHYSIKKQALFNSRRSDYSPCIGGTEHEFLYFSSTRSQAQGTDVSGITGMKNADIFMVEKDEKGKWKQPQTIDSELNSADDEGTPCLTADDKTMYLTRCQNDGSYPRYAQIVTSQRSDAAWSKPKVLELTKDTLSSYAHPALSPDGQWLYFVSDMPGGYGGLDIWRTRLSSSGAASGVENVGPDINTAGDEMFPVFRPNGDFYFSSDGHVGMGGLDIFKATPEAEDHWKVENLRCPMNSPGDDFGMTFEGLHNRGFFSSNRGDARGWDHIYSFECPEILQSVKGWVYERDGYELPEALVYMVGDDGTNLKLSVRSDGSFEQAVNPGVKYIFLGTCKGYLNHKEQLLVDSASVSQEYTLQFPLASITAPVLIDNIFYEFDKATLTPESTASLDELYQLLIENPNVTIELSAHTDCRGSEAYNERLSGLRAESVVNYLHGKGIPMDRLSPVGYGESRPKTVKRKMTERYPFLHEGDVLTEEYILKLNPEQQETCHALNRRTEFKVLRTTYGLGGVSK